jgi:hypothetical protein
MPILIEKHGLLCKMTEFRKWPEMMEILKEKILYFENCTGDRERLLKAAEKGDVIIFEGKRRAAASIISGILEQMDYENKNFHPADAPDADFSI